MAENFNLIFGSNAPTTTSWTDANYQTGWNTVGSTPPIADQFDFLQNRADKKALELYNLITPLINSAAASDRQKSTAYAVDDYVRVSGLPGGWFLKCTTAGTTANGDITLPTPLTESANIADGTVVWTTCKAAPMANLTSLISSLANGITVAADGTFSNPTLGISGLMATNGYICFGPNFGGLILQWGYRTNQNAGAGTVNFLINMSASMSYAIACSYRQTSSTASNTPSVVFTELNTSYARFKAYQGSSSASANGVGVSWLVIGY